MEWDDEEGPSKSLVGGILRAMATGMMIACIGLLGKAAFAGAAADLTAAAFAGTMGLMCLAGAATADRDCARAEEEDTGVCRSVQPAGVEVSTPVVVVSGSEVCKPCEGRFVERLEQEQRLRAGKGL